MDPCFRIKRNTLFYYYLVYLFHYITLPLIHIKARVLIKSSFSIGTNKYLIFIKIIMYFNYARVLINIFLMTNLNSLVLCTKVIGILLTLGLY